MYVINMGVYIENAKQNRQFRKTVEKKEIRVPILLCTTLGGTCAIYLYLYVLRFVQHAKTLRLPRPARIGIYCLLQYSSNGVCFFSFDYNMLYYIKVWKKIILETVAISYGTITLSVL